MFSDYQKTSQYMVSGASQTRVKFDWGKPDEIVEADSGESWVYRNRQDDKTFRFNFDKRGRLISSNIE
ncbi:MAG TPA: hypothetical protein P5246_02540 [Candidatus Omnitrophota bacterium]|jgi:hypothetical protein|nr:hypothetical protein [Candidatus Omnitrophota bacterium]HSA31331.1 hypothetical protein [Candidatus Omnitrophota bacterium]